MENLYNKHLLQNNKKDFVIEVQFFFETILSLLLLKIQQQFSFCLFFVSLYLVED